MATANYRGYLRADTVRLKKYFYVLRPILACKWIIANSTPPPVLFAELVDAMLESEMREPVENLLLLKKDTSELGEGNRIDALNAYIEQELEHLRQIIDKTPVEHKPSWEPLNKLFLTAIEM